MNDLKQYIENWIIWARGWPRIFRWYRDNPRGRISGFNLYWFCFYWFVDVGVNTLTGGDPEESISSRVHKDRHALVPGIIIRLIEIIDRGHGVRTRNSRVGELNRELSNVGQAFITLFWMAVTAHWVVHVLG